MLRILSHQDTAEIKALLSRSQLQDEQVNRSVREIVDRVREEGDEALLAYTHKFDRVRLEAGDLRVIREEIDAAYAEADPEYVEALR
ncbi:MAG TPA: histidinol dehydrogenase, partial [Clostridia bacterium]|nr:histidinol dehydrogenase [Clostridia bacterium]